jgi:hypothetical protein
VRTEPAEPDVRVGVAADVEPLRGGAMATATIIERL